MTAEGTYRLVMLVLLLALVAMRIYFMLRVRRAGERLLPGEQAVAREGGPLVFALRALVFFLLIAFLVMYFAGMPWIDRLAFPLASWLRWAGAVLGFFSILFWIWTQVALDVRWSAQLQLTGHHDLVTGGPYSRIRHPLYTAMCGWALSLALLNANWTFAAMAVLSITGVLLRVPREEAMLLEAFGGQYRDYMQHTDRFFPRWRGEGIGRTGEAASRYYVSRSVRLLKDFDRYARDMHPVLVRYFGEHQVASVIARARSEYEALIPQLPYIGGKQPFTQFVIFTGLDLSVYRAAAVYGKTVEQTGEILFEIGRLFLRTYPSYLGAVLGRINFSRWYLGCLRQRAVQSRQREYPGDYVYDFVEGDGISFDYGVDYHECASCKFLQAQGAPELAPYLCPVDILYSQALGWGLVRTTTLAEGSERCDFRFKKGGPTRVAVPSSMQQVISRGA
jgi:protein-S-isoprenylcysteine O-methyltransferase Ste14